MTGVAARLRERYERTLQSGALKALYDRPFAPGPTDVDADLAFERTSYRCFPELLAVIEAAEKLLREAGHDLNPQSNTAIRDLAAVEHALAALGAAVPRGQT